MRDILIVEDGLYERERLARLFAQAHLTVSTAESASEAERLLAVEQFRLAILDIGLTDKSGSYVFQLRKRSGQVPFIIILTGNPSVHLKQRFLDEGAVAYIVKASLASGNEALLETVQSLLGPTQEDKNVGMPLSEFLGLYVSPSSRALFLDSDNNIPSCPGCHGTDYIVSFAHKTQLPPLVEGKVICCRCHREMDPEVG